ncbi:hypothetical protein [Chroococcus sp. FPU101]|uniref:hypothetical protein n=1 Tax=Chroococcus sp. FPU101 TaxID=1974212 RepID=UPI001A905900|nr:hypothetical protein [Chroococcus sp. FPU101]GFE72125.1 hypothetical protein CFPU101_47350 [Chroococcus sp. FPU101]
MRYAKLVKLGGELIEAKVANYPDYHGFLRCPECGEPVFLRKTHQRGNIIIPDAFVHHKAVAEISVCELRVGQYDNENVIAQNAIARGQRLSQLKISLWKYLKTSLAFNFKHWSSYVADTKRVKMFQEIVQYGQEVIKCNHDFIINSTLPRCSDLILSNDERVAISPSMKKTIETFLKKRSRDWKLHIQITSEALDLFIDSPSMLEIRYRLCCCLCHPKILESMPELLDLDASTDEWRQKFLAYLTLQIVFAFLLIDWISIWND